MEYKGYTIKIEQDENADSPREWDNLGVMVCFHKRYTLGDKTDLKFDMFRSWDEMKAHIVKKLKATVILPVYMYDHSGITINTTGFSCPWDSGQIGFIYATAERIKKEYSVKAINPALMKKVENLLKGEVEVYDQFLRGDVHGYIVEKDGEHVDSCWGFYDKEEAMKEAKGVVDSETAKVPA